jgi:MYXO-CTERM domain-containing protein
MYEEIHAWNQAHPQQVIRAVTPYRWTQNDDGSGRDFCIGCSSALVQDMGNAIAMGRKWHNSGCHEPFGADAGVDAAVPVDGAVPADGAPPVDGSGPGPDGSSPPADAAPGADGSSNGNDNGNGVSTGCTCRSTPASNALPWILVLGVVMLRRRRRPQRRKDSCSVL